MQQSSAIGGAHCLSKVGWYTYCFYPRDAMLARVIAIATCLSVCH